MNIVADLPMKQKAYSCLKYDKMDVKTFDINQANEMVLEEVYN